MITRCLFRREYRLLSRCVSDKPKDNNINKPKQANENKLKDDDKAKLQELLKNMMAAPKIDENEYKQKFATAAQIKRKITKSDKIEVKVEKIEESITKAAEQVAQALGGNVKQTEADLLSKVLGQIDRTSTSLSDLLVGMKVDRSKDTEVFEKKHSRGEQVKNMVVRNRTAAQNTRFGQRNRHPRGQQNELLQSDRQPMTIDIFSGEPLGIFKSKGTNYGTKLEVWDNLKQREVTLATAQPPSNYFQKMILWTKQGKIWQFPINNEQGMEEEQDVHFSEHIFLETHLEDWCPKKGPIRHFMELVCVGLSKNAFYTAQEKKDHIMWYKDYFESKKDLLVEIEAWGNNAPSSKFTTDA